MNHQTQKAPGSVSALPGADDPAVKGSEIMPTLPQAEPTLPVPIDFAAILADCEYPGLFLELGTHPEGRRYLQVGAWVRDTEIGNFSQQRGRKWDLSLHMCPNEVVQTVFLAIQVFEEHERRERFTYRGRAIFSPHFDPLALAALCDDPESVQRRAGGAA